MSTIDELEAMLNSEGSDAVDILPDGTIRKLSPEEADARRREQRKQIEELRAQPQHVEKPYRGVCRMCGQPWPCQTDLARQLADEQAAHGETRRIREASDAEMVRQAVELEYNKWRDKVLTLESRLAAVTTERDAVKALLRLLEWSGAGAFDGSVWVDTCRLCDGYRPRHKPDCAVAAALKE
jgi:hypothetical protein